MFIDVGEVPKAEETPRQNSRLFLSLSQHGVDWQKGRRERKKLPEEMNGRCVTPSSLTLPYLSHRPRGSGK